MAPPAGSDSGLRPPQGQSRRRKPIWLSSYITYSKGAKSLAPFEYNMERTECVPKGDFGFLKFGCLQLKVRDEKNLPVLKTTSGSTKILVHLKTNVYRKNRMRSQRRLWPCVGRRPESDPAGGVFGNAFGSLTYSVFKYKHQNFYLVQTSSSEFVQ